MQALYANFYDDVRGQLLRFLADGGFPVAAPTADSVMLACELYFNVRLRLKADDGTPELVGLGLADVETSLGSDGQPSGLT